MSEGEGGRLWAGLRGLLFGGDSEPTLRDQIEEAIEEHEDDAPAKGDLSAAERQRLWRNCRSTPSTMVPGSSGLVRAIWAQRSFPN